MIKKFDEFILEKKEIYGWSDEELDIIHKAIYDSSYRVKADAEVGNDAQGAGIFFEWWNHQFHIKLTLDPDNAENLAYEIQNKNEKVLKHKIFKRSELSIAVKELVTSAQDYINGKT